MNRLFNAQKPLAALNQVVTYLALMMVISGVVFSWLSWREEKKDQINNLRNIMEIAEKSIDSYFSGIEKDMKFLTLDLIGPDGQIDLDYAFNLIQRYLRLHQDIVNITFMRADGQVLFTGKSPPGPNLKTLAQESSFQQFRDELKKGQPLSMGQPLVAVSSKVWIIPLRYGLWDQNGNLQYIISANLPVEILQKFWKNAPFTKSSAMGLMRDDGFLVSRYPVPAKLEMEQIYGKPRTGSLIHYLKKEGFPANGYVEGPSSLDGPGFVNSFCRLEHFPITLFIALPISDIFAGWWENVWAPFLLASLILIGAFSFYRMALKFEVGRETERKSAAAKLQASEEKYRSLVETSSDCIWEVDPEGRFTYLSPKFKDLLGYDPEDFLGHSPEELVPEDETPRIIEHFRDSVSTKQIFSLAEHNNRHRDGRLIVVEIRGVPFFSPDGEYKGMRGITRDVTNRRQSEDAVRLHLAVMETVAEGIFLIGVDDNIIKWTNHKFDHMFGYDPGEMIGMHIDRINAPKEKTPTETRISIVEELLQLREWQGEIENVKKDGTHFWCYVHVSLFDHPQFGKVMVSANTDITEYKRIEQDVQSRERDLRAILNNIPSMVGYYDKNLCNRFGNIVYSDWYGIDPNKMPGMNIEDVLGGERFRKNLPHIEAALAGQPQIFERTLSLSGSATEKNCLVQYIPDVLDGQVQGFYVLVSDITPVKVAEEQRMQLAKTESLNRMAGAIAHHFNNQLYVVIGNLELLMESIPLGSDNHVMAVDALTASHKAADISKMMLTYLGQSAGRQEIQDLSETCHKGLLMLQGTIPKNVTLNTDIPFPGPIVAANTKLILQIITNLATNAWESISDHGAITVTVKTVSSADISSSNRYPVGWQPEESRYACIEVLDTGCGIPQENLKKIFDPFFTTKFTGRGLGLSVVLGILGIQAGAIMFENKAGGGCAFRVYLPLVSEIVPVETEKYQKDMEVQAGGVVLLIDDQDQVRNMAGKMLSRLGYSVLEAADGVEAVDIFQQQKEKITCVITDLTMPRMNGWEVLDALRNISPDIPVILSSGYDEAQVMADEHNELPNAFLGKPYRLKDLDETIRLVLKKRNDRSSLFRVVNELENLPTF